MKRKASISHDETMIAELRRDPEFAAEYLKAALEDEDEPQVLLIALRHLAEAKGGLAKIAKAAGIERESLYRALSKRGNPLLIAKALAELDEGRELLALAAGNELSHGTLQQFIVNPVINREVDGPN
jgi:probable addiction module antidote protein